MSLLAHRGVMMDSAGMPPTVLDITTYTTGATATTTHAVPMPATVNPGDLLLVLMCGPNTAPTAPAGWTLLNTISTGGVTSFPAYYRVADGTEDGTTVTFTTTSSRLAAQTYRIQAGTYSGTPERITAQSSATANPDPPSITPTWGAANSLFIATFGARSNNTIMAWPYVNGRTHVNTSGSTTNDRQIATCWALSNTAVEDPTAYTVSGTTNGGTLMGTVAVRPV